MAVLAADHATELAAFDAEMRQHERRNFSLIVLDGAMFAFAISLLSEVAIIPAFVQALTDSPALIGLVGATFALGRYLPQLLGAHIVLGRSLRKPSLVWIVVAERGGILAIAVVAQLIGIIPNGMVVALFFIAFAAYSITTGLIGPVYGDFLAKALPRSRGWYFGLSQLIGGVLGFAAALMAEQVLATNGFPGGNQILFWVCFGLSFLSIPIVLSLKDRPFPGVSIRPSFAKTLQSIPPMLRANRPYRRFLMTRALLASAMLGAGFVVVDGLASGVLSAPDAALLAAVFILSQAGGGFILSMLGNYAGWKMVVVACGLLLLAGMTGALFAGDIVGYAAVYVALGMANAATIVGDPNMSIELAPSTQTSLYLGTTSTLLAPFFIAGPLVGGFIASLWGYEPVFILAAIFAVVGLIGAVRMPEPRSLLTSVTP